MASPPPPDPAGSGPGSTGPDGGGLPLRWVVIGAVAAACGMYVGIKEGRGAGLTVALAVAALLHAVIP